MEIISSGFMEIEHTADTAIRVWADDLPTLFSEAAKGMYSLMGIKFDDKLKKLYSIILKAKELESLLVMFLEELLYINESEGLGFNRLNLEINEGYGLSAQLEGIKISGICKEIKAVTFHNMQINNTKLGYEVVIVFDV
jgi:SHS2 domain-containing protein